MGGIVRHSHPKPAGTIIVTDLDGGVTQRDTLQCVHCGRHWVVKPGSGRRRGYCMNCNGPHCGGPECWKCVPFERRLEHMES